MLNNMYACSEHLETLWGEVSTGWQRAVGASGMADRMRVDALQAKKAVLHSHASEMSNYVCMRLIAYELKPEIAGALYRQGPRDPPQQMHALLPTLAERCARIPVLVALRARQQARAARSQPCPCE